METSRCQALLVTLEMLALPGIPAPTLADALHAALHHPDGLSSAFASAKALANVALQREIGDTFGQTDSPSPPIRAASHTTRTMK